MSRWPVVLIVGGCFAVLIVLVLMWRSLRSEESQAPASTSEVASESAPSSSAATAAGQPAPGSPAGQLRTQVAQAAAKLEAATSGGSAPPSMEDAPPATRMNTKNLHFGGTQLREQAAAVEGLVRQCVDQAASSKPSGDAVLTYVVAKKGDKYVVEDTGVDGDKTSLKDERLLECLRETARSMKFQGLPREAEALVVTRGVKIENGVLAEYKHIGFSYIR